MGGHAGERYIYLWQCFCAKIRTEKDLHIPNRVNANIVKFLTVFTKQAWPSVQGTAGFAERHSVNRAFLWRLKEMLAVPRLLKPSQVCKGHCSTWPVFFYEDMKMSFSVPCVITAFKTENSPFYSGILKDPLHPFTPFPLRKKNASWCPFVTSSTAGMKPPRWSGWQNTKLFFRLQESFWLEEST